MFFFLLKWQRVQRGHINFCHFTKQLLSIFFFIIPHNITSVGSIISPTSLSNFNATTGKHGFIFKNTEIDS